MWAREPKDADGERGGLLESVRWTEGYERVAELAAELPDTRLVHVADREADIMELMARARDLDHPADWLIRSRHHRALPEGGKLWAAVTAGAPLGEVCFTLPARHGQKAREGRQQVWAKRVDLSDGRHGRVAATCIVLNKKPLPKIPPRLNEVVRLVARLGGFLARKADGEPGAKTLWQGLQRVTDFATGLRYAREAHVL